MTAYVWIEIIAIVVIGAFSGLLTHNNYAYSYNMYAQSFRDVYRMYIWN